MSERALSEALDCLYACVLDPSGWPRALEQLTRFVGGSSALLFHQDRIAHTGQFLQAFNTDPEWTQAYFDRYIAINPVIPFLAFMDVGATSAFSRIVPETEMVATPFYREWMAPQNLWDVVVYILDQSDSTSGLLGIARTRSDGPATELSLERMASLGPHVRRAVHLSSVFADMFCQRDALRETVERMPQAVILLDQSGGAVLVNGQAQELMRLNDRVGVQDGQVRLAGGSQGALLSWLGGLNGGGRVAEGQLSLEPGAGLHVELVAIADRSGYPVRPVAAMYLRQAGPKQPAPLQVLAARYGFTPRELQVFMGVVQFGGVPQVAQMFGLSPTTVRTHLQRVFDKTGVRDQRDLIRIAASLPAPTDWP